MESDIFSEEDFPIDDIKMVCIDEAHKSKGKFAYVEVVKRIYCRNRNFRVLALSATPGRHIHDVVEVIQNLLISHVEIRAENSIDVQKYTHRKNLTTMVIPLGQELSEIKERFIAIMDPYVRKLLEQGVITGNINSLTKNILILKHAEYRQGSFNGRAPNFSDINSAFSKCISLYYALESLERSGIQIFLNFFDDPNNSTNQKYFVSQDFRLKAFLDELKEKYSKVSPFNISNQTLPNGTMPKADRDLEYGHPKYEKLKEILLDYFKENKDSRVMVFCELRETTLMVHSILAQHQPLINPKILVGQGSSSAIKAVSQKEQIAAIKDFKEGKNNVLICTCVGEEGLDIGEVELIVCMDMSSKNPTRFVQRIGRTGRKRAGKVIMLVTEGKEHGILKEVLYTRDRTNQKISKSREVLNCLLKDCPRMVPTEFNPKCVQTFIKLPEENLQEIEKKGKKQPAKRRITQDDPEAGPSSASEVNQKSKKQKNGPDIQNYFTKIPKPTPVIPEEPEIVVLDDVCSTSLPAPSLHNISSVDLDSRYRKILKDIKNFKSVKFQLPKARDILQDANYPNFLKKAVLEKNLSFINDILESKGVLSVLEGDPESNLDDIQLIKGNLKALEKVFGGNVLQSGENYREKSEMSEKFKKIAGKLEGTVETSFISRVRGKFLDYMENTKEPEPLPEVLPEIQVQELNDLDLDGINFVENHSKYQKTVGNSFNKNQIFNSMTSTPTPAKRTPKIQKKNKLSPQESPLLKAFENSIKKKMNSISSTPMKPVAKLPEVKKNEPESRIQETLAHFGLKSLDDLFASSDEDELYDDGFTTSKVDRNNSVLVKGSPGFSSSYSGSPGFATLLEPPKNSGLKVSLVSKDQSGSESAPSPTVSTSLKDLPVTTSLKDPRGSPSFQSVQDQLNSPAPAKLESTKFSSQISSDDEVVRSSIVGQLVPKRKHLISQLNKKGSVNPLNERIPSDLSLTSLESSSSSNKTPWIRNHFESPKKLEAIKESPTFKEFEDSDGESDALLANIPLNEAEIDKKSSISDEADFEIDLNQSLETVSQILRKLNTQKVVQEDIQKIEDDDEEIISSQPENLPVRKIGIGLRGKKKKEEEEELKKVVDDIWNIDKIFADLEEDDKGQEIGAMKEEKDAEEKREGLEVDGDSSVDTVIYDLEQEVQENSTKVLEESTEKEPFNNFKSPSARSKNQEIYSIVEILENDENKDLNQILGPSKKVEKSPSIFTRRLDSFRFSSQNRSHYEKSQPQKSPPVTSPITSKPGTSFQTTQSPGIVRLPRKLAQIISSSDEAEDDDFQFLTAQTSISQQPGPSNAQAKTRTMGSKLTAKRKACAFLDAEAGVSGSENDCEDEEDSELEQFIDDSLICSQDPVDDSRIDMQAKYMQSVKSPPNRPGRFKIPQPKQITNMSDIFSQMPSDDDEDEFVDSFVVQNDDHLVVESQVILKKIGDFPDFSLIFLFQF